MSRRDFGPIFTRRLSGSKQVGLWWCCTIARVLIHGELAHCLMEIPKVLRFNVGGALFLTTFSTINARGPCFLTTLVQQHYTGQLPCLEIDGALFVDRSGVAFEYVLQFLRTGTVVYAGGCTLAMLRDELAFYCIPMDTDESNQVTDSYAQSLFSETEESNSSYREASRFLTSLWPVLSPFLQSKARLGLSSATLVIRRAAVDGGRVSYSLPDVNFEFISSVDFNQPADP
jgi:hypothetical protein